MCHLSTPVLRPFQSQERKADVYARGDYKITAVFSEQTAWGSKDIPPGGPAEANAALLPVASLLESPSEPHCVSPVEKKISHSIPPHD